MRHIYHVPFTHARNIRVYNAMKILNQYLSQIWMKSGRGSGQATSNFSSSLTTVVNSSNQSKSSCRFIAKQQHNFADDSCSSLPSLGAIGLSYEIKSIFCLAGGRQSTSFF